MLQDANHIPEWKHIATTLDGDNFSIDGIAVWSHSWQDQRETAIVTDPLYGQTHRFSVYRIEEDGRTIEFAASEFSNNVWGFYLRNR